MSETIEKDEGPSVGVLSRREAIRRVSAMLGGVAFVGGTALLTACERQQGAARTDSTAGRGSTNANLRESTGTFTPQDVAYFDEVADTILPTTSTPGAKAANVGHFIAVMVTATYDPKDQEIFKRGVATLNEESGKANGGKTFVEATPEQRLALLTRFDREAKTYMDRREEARRRAKQGNEGDKYLGDQRQENAPEGSDVNPAPAITADAPTHWFRMVKELTMLGYFTSELGMAQALRYVESPGRYDPCAPYKAGEKAWAGHA